MITLYVIRSITDNFRYVGITNDLERRLKQHSAGLNKSTRLHKPFKLVFSEEYKNYKEARKREIFLKSGVGRKFLNDLKI
jgi:putative endonuclease